MFETFAKRNPSEGFKMDGENKLISSGHTIVKEAGKIVCQKDGPWDTVFSVPENISYSLFEKLMFECLG